jgi:hypothetical protein
LHHVSKASHETKGDAAVDDLNAQSLDAAKAGKSFTPPTTTPPPAKATKSSGKPAAHHTHHHASKKPAPAPDASTAPAPDSSAPPATPPK